MDTTIAAPVSFSSRAILEVKRLMRERATDPKKFLRVGVKGGGCSGLSYILGFDEKQENDELYEYEGFNYIMNKSHGIYLTGMEVDWHDGLDARGFMFTNPNAGKTCGCGSSFSV